MFHLFSSSLSQDTDLKRNLKRAYRRLPKTERNAFLKGLPQAEKVLLSLAAILDMDLRQTQVEQYISLLSIYAWIVNWKTEADMDLQKLLHKLQSYYGNLFPSERKLQNILSFCLLNSISNDFCIESQEDFDLFSDNGIRKIGAPSSQFEESARGKVPAKPIYTYGISGARIYLDSLLTEKGQKLIWRRTGSLTVPQVLGAVDIYNGFLPSGKLYQTLYISIYGFQNPSSAPIGFQFI